MRMDSVKRLELDSAVTRRLLIAAQLLVLTAYVTGLRFLINTTGGTLFVFSTVAPLLIAIATLVVIGVLVYHYRRSHSLFVFETFAPGQIIFREGGEGDCAYFIHSGEVEVLQRHNGVENVVARLSKGEYFGEVALISRTPRNATVRAATRTQVAVLGKTNFLIMLSLMPSTQEDVMQKVKERAMKHTAG